MNDPAALAAQAGKMKKTEQNAAKGPAPEMVKAMTDLYTKHGGDCGKLAEATGADKALMEKNKPKDAADFAAKVLAGAYAA